MNPGKLLRQLIDDHYGGSQAAFARAIKRSPSQVNQWLSGHRTLDLKGMAIIERAIGRPGYFVGMPMVSEPENCYNVTPLPAREDPMIDLAIELMRGTDLIGRAMCLGAIKSALAEYQPEKRAAQK